MDAEHGHSVDDVRKRLAEKSNSGHLRDFVYGGIDGAVTTFAIVAGVEGAGLSHGVIVALGIANVLADGFSMAAGNYTGTKAELDNLERLREIGRRHIRDYPEGEREEVRQILAAKGLDGQGLELAVEAVTRDEETWTNLMLVDEYGLSPVDPNPLPAAMATFIAFLLCGLVPLLPFLFGMEHAFTAAIISTAFVFFGIGTAKSRWAIMSWWRSGLETLSIGAIAALIAYYVGHLASQLAA